MMEGDPMVNMRVDRYLGLRFQFLSRSRWQKKCNNGEVFNRWGPIAPTYRVQVGDQLFHHYPQSIEPQVNTGVFCLSNHQHIIGVYKPPQMPMHEGGAYRKNTFFEICRQKWGTPWRAVHRLDRQTSGVVVCAKTSTMRAKLAAAFRHQTTSKVYYAIAMGPPPASSWSVNKPIGHTTQTTWRTKRWVDPHGKPAITHFQVISSHKNFVWLKIRPIHGRTHQIRIHAAVSGVPLVGDVRYHPDEEVFLRFLDHGYDLTVLKQIIAPRLCLHAGSITFHLRDSKSHSTTPIRIHSPIPHDLKWIWQNLIPSDHLHAAHTYLNLSENLHESYKKSHSLELPKTLSITGYR